MDGVCKEIPADVRVHLHFEYISIDSFSPGGIRIWLLESSLVAFSLKASNFSECLVGSTS